MSNHGLHTAEKPNSSPITFLLKIRKWIFYALIGKSPKRTFIRTIIIAFIAFIVFRFFLLPVRLRGISMEPTYRDKSFNFVNTLSYRFRNPARGDVIAIRMAGRHVLLFKRIIGLPGEQVAFRNGVLLVNGKEMPEPYVTFKGSWDMDEVTISKGEFFVAGDNRNMPVQTHALGRVKKKKIMGGPLF
jgi:signal peptidase I